MNYESSLEIRKSLVSKVFLYMIFGIIVTAVTSGIFFINETLSLFIRRHEGGIIITQVVFALCMNLCLLKIPISITKMLYYVYCFFTGITFCVFCYLYTPESITFILVLTFCIFVIMSIYGYYTKEDLSKYDTFFRMGLFALIIVGLIGWLLKSYFMRWGIDWEVSIFAIVLFTGLIAYDMNKISKFSEEAETKEEAETLAIYGAFSLYLDFVNLYIFLLRLAVKMSKNR